MKFKIKLLIIVMINILLLPNLVSYFCGKSHFEADGIQNYGLFQMTHRYFNTVGNNDSNILSWKPKRLSDESVKPPDTSNKMLNPSLNCVGTKARVKFKGYKI